MKTGNFWWLAGVVASHKERRVLGRTRLQKTMKLLQRLGLPTDYLFTTFFYGPYSEGLLRDIQLLSEMGLLHEEECSDAEGSSPYFVVQATGEAEMPELAGFAAAIRAMECADLIILELAATYDAFREMGSGHEQAVQRLRHKKAAKWSADREERSRFLLRQLGLPAE
ncbi:MAG: hypothetical protein U0840_00930 [Gemmataceae bacterium]